MTESSVLDHEVAAVRPTRLWTSFARQVELRPDAPALVWHGVETSYQQLAELACRAQAAIDALGASPTDMLAVPATKSPGTIAVTLACLRAGRPVMLPSPTLPEATLRRLVAAAGCSRVVTADELLGTGSTGRPAAPAAPAAPAPAAPDDVAFVLTTSGSTRLPKIVPISAGAVERFADWAAPYFGIEPGTAVLNYAPLNFDLCFLDVWATLHHGGRVVLVDPDTATRGEHVLRLLRDNDVQVLQSVPMLYQLLADAAGSPPAPLGAVRHAVFTGDHMPPTCLARLPGLFPGARLHHDVGGGGVVLEVVAHHLRKAGVGLRDQEDVVGAGPAGMLGSADGIGVFVHAVDRALNLVQVVVGNDAVAGRLVELDGEANWEVGVANEPETAGLVERPQRITVAQYGLLDVACSTHADPTTATTDAR